jgi:hypothetical protein
LENRRATPQKAPGPGAWGLLLWGRTYRNAFYEKLLPRALAVRDEDETERQIVKREKKSVAYLESLLGEMVNEDAEKLRVDIPGEVWKRVRDLLSRWSKRFGLTLPSEAKTSLEDGVAKLVHDSIAAIGNGTPAGG